MFTPGDKVRLKGRQLTGEVTFPGLTGIPGRTYVRHKGFTAHYSPEELERA